MVTESDYWNYKCTLDSAHSDLRQGAAMASLITEQEYKLFAMLKPSVSIDGNQWCVLYGENLQEGIAGFGDTLYLAILDFNKAFDRPITNQ